MVCTLSTSTRTWGQSEALPSPPRRSYNQNMYKGVLRDDERRREKMLKREEELQASKQKRELYERVQTVERVTPDWKNVRPSVVCVLLAFIFLDVGTLLNFQGPLIHTRRSQGWITVASFFGSISIAPAIRCMELSIALKNYPPKCIIVCTILFKTSSIRLSVTTSNYSLIWSLRLSSTIIWL